MSAAGRSLTFLDLTARNLYRQPVRTSLTTLGVAAGVIAVVALTTIVQGWHSTADAVIHINQTDLMVFQANVAANILSTLDEEETRAKLLALPEVAAVRGTLWHLMPVEHEPFSLLLGLRGSDREFLQAQLLDGRCASGDDEVMLGTIAQRKLVRKVGDALNIGGQPYRVVGIFRTGVVFFDYTIVISLPQLQRLAGKEGRATAFQVQLRPGFDSAAVGARIERQHPELAAVATADEFNKVDRGLEMAEQMVWPVSLVAVIVGGIIVANTMWMSVLERTRQIGLLRAVGWSRGQVVGMVLLEATSVGLLACLVGCPLGTGLARLAIIFPVGLELSWTPFLLALVLAVSLSVLAALLPAWRAAHISPAEALRYE